MTTDLTSAFEKVCNREEYLGASLRFMTADTRGVVAPEARADFEVVKSRAGTSPWVAGYVARIEPLVEKRTAAPRPTTGNKLG